MNRSLLLGSLLAVQLSSVATAATVSQVPLFLTSTVKPNIMLLIDNSDSMQHVAVTEPYRSATQYTCGGTVLDNSAPITVTVESGVPFFNGYQWPNGVDAGRCFNPVLQYEASLFVGSGAGAAQYSGNYLNWYFGSDDTGATYPSTATRNWGGAAGSMKPSASSRMEAAKRSAAALVDAIDNANVGLATFVGGVGADIKVSVASVATVKAALKTAISALEPGGSTPLAESLQQLGRYFVGDAGAINPGHQTAQSCSVNGQWDGDLVLHPATSAIAQSDDSLFHKSPAVTEGQSSESPICHSCQKNFVILLSDGLPSSDTDIPAALQTYDCQNNCDTAYLDDVAKALYDIDLRPDIAEINNLTTYTIGFADDLVINDPLLKNTATNGGGEFYTAKSTTELTTALKSAVSAIKSKAASASAVATSSTRLSTSTVAFQAQFNSADWSGQLSARLISSTGAGAAVWQAENNIPLHDGGRNVYAWDPTAAAGISFETGNRALINAVVVSAGAASLTDDQINYIRGDRRNEESVMAGTLRTRTAPSGQSPLGDIINSDPLFVAKPNFGYSRLGGTEGSKYKTFRSSASYKNRSDMIYVGGNDGMLHGFSFGYDATATPAAVGSELFSFIPNAVFGKLGLLTAPGYNHQYLVDGSPVLGDAYLDLDGNGTNESWRTVLVGTTGAGGSGVFALDVTTPSSFGASNVLWDLDNTKRNFADLGYTLGQATIARMPDGEFYAVFGNGYHSVAGKAVLYLVRLDDATQFKTLVLEATSAVNGLSSPLVVDADDNRIVEAIYAGDLQGNLWKVSLGVDDSGNLTLDAAFKQADNITPAPLFVARDQTVAGTRQPITAPLEVGEHNGGGAMVYFGTGQYYATGDDDVSAAQTQTFYAIRDHAGAAVSRTELVAQTIDIEDTTTFSDFNVRLTSDNAVAYPGKKGWYMDLTLAGIASSLGERVVDAPRLLDDQVLFTTLIPSDISCSSGGAGWLMKLNALSGRRVLDRPFDLDRDGVFDDQDQVATSGVNVAVSGLQFNNLGIISSPSVLTGTDKDMIVVGGSGSGSGGGAAGGGTDGIDIGRGSVSGRQSWQQLQ